MNYFEIPEFSSAAPFGSNAAFRAAVKEDQARSSLERLAARIHRCAAAPEGYRFVANIAASTLARAMLAIKYCSGGDSLRLITPAVDDAGNPVDDIAVYVKAELPDPGAFWSMFHSASETTAA
jgi:hypothetical protein